jgi:hypothetical protein
VLAGWLLGYLQKKTNTKWTYFFFITICYICYRVDLFLGLQDSFRWENLHIQSNLLMIIKHIFHCNAHFSCQNISSIHTFVLHTNGLKVDVDYIPELGFFFSGDLGSKYHNLYIKTPCLMRPFSEFPSMVFVTLLILYIEFYEIPLQKASQTREIT